MKRSPTPADVVHLLEVAASIDAPTLDPAFADRLERRLRSVHETIAVAPHGEEPEYRRYRHRLAQLPLTALAAIALAATAATAAVVVPVARHFIRHSSTTSPATSAAAPSPTSITRLVIPPANVAVGSTTSTTAPTPGTTPTTTPTTGGAPPTTGKVSPTSTAPTTTAPNG